MGSTTVRRPRSFDRYDSRYTVPTVKYAESVMAWGSYSGKMGRTGLYFISKNKKGLCFTPKNKEMNADAYLHILQGAC